MRERERERKKEAMALVFNKAMVYYYQICGIVETTNV